MQILYPSCSCQVGKNSEDNNLRGGQNRRKRVNIGKQLHNYNKRHIKQTHVEPSVLVIDDFYQTLLFTKNILSAGLHT
jgi:hypothetical protein